MFSRISDGLILESNDGIVLKHKSPDNLTIDVELVDWSADGYGVCGFCVALDGTRNPSKYPVATDIKEYAHDGTRVQSRMNSVAEVAYRPLPGSPNGEHGFVVVRYRSDKGTSVNSMRTAFTTAFSAADHITLEEAMNMKNTRLSISMKFDVVVKVVPTGRNSQVLLLDSDIVLSGLAVNDTREVLTENEIAALRGQRDPFNAKATYDPCTGLFVVDDATVGQYGDDYPLSTTAQVILDAYSSTNAIPVLPDEPLPPAVYLLRIFEEKEDGKDDDSGMDTDGSVTGDMEKLSIVAKNGVSDDSDEEEEEEEESKDEGVVYDEPMPQQPSLDRIHLNGDAKTIRTLEDALHSVGALAPAEDFADAGLGNQVDKGPTLNHWYTFSRVGVIFARTADISIDLIRRVPQRVDYLAIVNVDPESTVNTGGVSNGVLAEMLSFSVDMEVHVFSMETLGNTFPDGNMSVRVVPPALMCRVADKIPKVSSLANIRRNGINPAYPRLAGFEISPDCPDIPNYFEVAAPA